MLIDWAMKKRGFVKTKENRHGASYERRVDEYGYTHCIYIGYKRSGRHLVQTYADPCVYAEGRGAISENVGMELPEVFLVGLKAIYMNIRWRWMFARRAQKCSA